MKIGVLALQGAFVEHISVLQRLNVDGVAVRLPEDLNGLDGLIIPGGESTTIATLIELFNLREPLTHLATDSFPIFGTCAGMILLARKAPTLPVAPLGAIDLEVRRNAFGRQVDSFEVDLPISALGPKSFRAIFIRAPYIDKVGDGVEVLATLPTGRAVAARQGKIIVAAFHPELSTDDRLHRYFLDIARAPNSERARERCFTPANK